MKQENLRPQRNVETNEKRTDEKYEKYLIDEK